MNPLSSNTEPRTIEVASMRNSVQNHLEITESKNNAEENDFIGADSRVESYKECLRLDENKRKLIKKSYIHMKIGGVNNILMVFISGIPDSSLISSDQLRNHAKVYLGGMTIIVDNMNSGNETDFRKLIRRMARTHAKFGVRKFHLMSMLPEYLRVLELAGAEVTPEVQEAWSTLFDIIGNLLSKLKQ
ncbi:hypothetical protein FO519_003584 [Halicephalobus sp. NKZ332]|nr:hypothetical protein FO519_003584 [Halicephalobus sp. NKZ332]